MAIVASLAFRAATDELLACITHDQLADALGVSVSTVRQARLDEGAKARRKPPEGWQGVVADLAEMHADRLLRLSKALNKAAAKSLKESAFPKK
ncbi:MAG: hypothetical protein WDM86_14985 [Rhizomicrobium sp.]